MPVTRRGRNEDMLAEPDTRRRRTLRGTVQKLWLCQPCGCRTSLRCAGLVARAACPEPDPISNSAVKHASAHGTVSQDTGESVAARPAQRKIHNGIPSSHSDMAKTVAAIAATHRHRPKPVGAGWSSPVARQAHNLKVTGSNPVPATKIPKQNSRLGPSQPAVSCPTPVVTPDLPVSTIVKHFARGLGQGKPRRARMSSGVVPAPRRSASVGEPRDFDSLEPAASQIRVWCR